MAQAPESSEATQAPVRTEVRGRVLIATIDRPEARNAINVAVAQGISAALDRLDDEDELACGVLTGAGGMFCAGMDLKAFVAGEIPTLLPGRGFAGIVEQPPAKPLVAAVEGFALAGGFEVALACDLVVAAHDARFGLPEVTRGLVAAGGGLVRLAQRIPSPIAMEWALTGAPVSAERAYAVGLVTRLTAPGEALAEAVALAEQIAANGPLAVRATKRILIECGDWPRAEQFDRVREINAPVRSSEDAREGATAFAQKRAPIWRGR